jgi:hypothetical protein
MLACLRGKASDRKLRLFICTVCRGIWEFITDPVASNTVAVAEQFADGLVTTVEVDAARVAVQPKVAYFVDMDGFAAAATAAALWPDAWAGAEHAVGIAICEFHEGTLGYEGAWRDSAYLLRDLFGNPFRPVTADPAWLTPTVTSLAQAIYDDRAFDRLPVLGDALEDAGCTNADLLAHCRSRQEHARGCWAVDLVLGKR